MTEKSFESELRTCYYNNDMEGFRQALASGADSNYRESDDLYAPTLLCQAVSDGNESAVRLLLSYGAEHIDRKNRVTAPLLAVFHSNYDILDLFFATIALKDLDITVETSSTLVLQAVTRRNFEMVRYLIERECNINARNEDSEGYTPLDYAVRNDDLEMVRYLLEKGADPSQRGLSNYTAFESAQWTGIQHKAEILALLSKYQS